MIRWLIAATLLMKVGYCLPAIAQKAQGATDNELYAAFCTGVIDDEIERLKPSPIPSLEEAEKKLRQSLCDLGNCSMKTDEEVRRDAQSHLAYREEERRNLEALQAERQTMRQRFAAYLLATGVMTDRTRGEAALGLAIAMKQGRQSSQQCMVTVTNCIETARAKWPPPQTPHTPAEDEATGRELMTCMDADAAGCAKSRRCHKPDNLPF
jgi:hypothetical protein